jgi:hypothetical protein
MVIERSRHALHADLVSFGIQKQAKVSGFLGQEGFLRIRYDGS